MPKRFILFALLFITTTACFSQKWGIRSSATMLATATPNLEISYTLANQVSLHLPVLYNPWVWQDNSRFQQVTVMPGARYWLKATHVHAFASAYAIASRFHVGGWIDKKYRYDGRHFGAGFGGGYSWILNDRWNAEFELGVGIVYTDYDKCGWEKHSKRFDHVKGIRVIPAKIDFSFVYLF